MRLDGENRGLYDGLAYYGRLPLTIGMRGHAQMIPFGMGNGIISVAARDKLRYFTDDIGHPELAVDPRDGDWSTQVLDLVDAWFGDFAAARARFATVRERLWRTTLDNLAGISRVPHRRRRRPGAFVPLSPFERELSMNTYTSSALHDAEAERSANLRSELKATRQQLARAEKDARGTGGDHRPGRRSTSPTATSASGWPGSGGADPPQPLTLEEAGVTKRSLRSFVRNERSVTKRSLRSFVRNERSVTKGRGTCVNGPCGGRRNERGVTNVGEPAGGPS